MSREKQDNYYELERLLRVRKIDIEKQGCDLYSLLHKTETEEQSLARYLIDCGYCKASDLAEEIFAEIYKALNNSVKTELFKGTWFDYSKFITEVDKLKKKYTERGKEQDG